MEQKSRSKIIFEALGKIPCIINIRWAKDNQVFVDVIEEITGEEKEYIKNLLLQMHDKYEVIFQIAVPKDEKKWWQKLLEKLKWQKK
ncbi:MAG: hypothetical protein HYV47_00405 [Candidatus Nealsonbacteria bacterium]|nr:hypothetical protein [Candidatus Nealsonbacteria bacterium]